MNQKEGYIERSQRKKILLLGDDIRFFSGIATIAREIVVGTAHRYNYAVIGGAINHPDKGKRLDLCESTNQVAKIKDAEVYLYPTDGYGNPDMIRNMIKYEKPDAIFFITDPRYYTWLFEIEHEIRSKIPMIYLQIWDCEPAPLYNINYYRSCDALLAISKQTKILNEVILGEEAKSKIIKYVPHGINQEYFYPIEKDSVEYDSVKQVKTALFGNKEYDFVILFNSRNIRRKSIPDTILSFKHFIDGLPKEKADKCCLLLHTQRLDENGTDLPAVIELLLGERKDQVVFSNPGSVTNYMNVLYNISDATILLSSNEGWGLSITEAMMAGKMIIANVTGGMQDQMRFVDENGKWIEFDESFCTNHLAKYKECGEWAIPVFPSNISIQGSIPTPYIFDDRVDFRDAAKALRELHDMPEEERERRGKLAREWVLSEESGMSAIKMCDNVIQAVDETIDTFKPRKRFEIYKIEERPLKTLKFPVSLP
jgi:glycosyltransferase involved in cell wall biosynthesis